MNRIASTQVLRRAWPLAWMIAVASNLDGGARAQCSSARIDDGTAHATFGFTVARIDDLDCDGAGDFIVGAPDDAGSYGPGKVFVYSGATSTLLYSLTGSSSGDAFGDAIVAVRDVDGDGVPDFLVGAPYEATSGFQAGRVYLYSGKTGSFVRAFGPPNYSLPAGYFGAALAEVGDLNGDGKPEALIGAPVLDSAYVFDLSTGSILHTFTGTRYERLGVAVAGMRDVNGDGKPDFAIAEERTSTVFVYSGSDWTRLWSMQQNGNFGTSLANVGDVDDDHVDDLVAGAPYSDMAAVISGANGALITFLFGDKHGDKFGEWVGNAGDVNGDGRQDIAVGAANAAGGRGKVFVFSGANGSLLISRQGECVGDQFGRSVVGFKRCGCNALLIGARTTSFGATSGGSVYVTTGLRGKFARIDGTTHATLGKAVATIDDLDGDKVPDYLVGAPDDAGAYGPGKVFVYSGASKTLLYSLSGGASGDAFGDAIAAVRDVDGDGVPDFLVGATYEATAGFQAGRAYLYSGKTGTLIRNIAPPNYSSPAGYFGAALADVGDLNGDGISEVLIGAPVLDKAYVIDVTSGAVLRVFTGSQFNRLGVAVAGLGDVNGDGTPDFAIAEERTSTVYVYSGCGWHLLWSLTQSGNFGTSLRNVGDVDGDGINDLLGGAPYSDLAVLMSGANGSILKSMSVQPGGQQFGGAVAGVGDVDRDGVRDFAVGAPYANGAQGCVYVYSGATGALLFKEQGENAGDSFGLAIGTATDTGSAEIIVGARTTNFGGTSGGSAYFLQHAVMPEVTSLSIQQTDHHTPASMTITGRNFTIGGTTSVTIGGALASSVVVVDDQTITCTSPAGEPGLADVTVEKNFGMASNRDPFIFSPAMTLDGTPAIGNTIDVNLWCSGTPSSVDYCFCFLGFPPPTDVAIRNYDGILRIAPFIEVGAFTVSGNEETLSGDIPNDPTLQGLTFFVQSLIGKGYYFAKGSAFTNCLSITIQ